MGQNATGRIAPTPREREVFHLVVSGRLKQIAFKLGTAEKTIKIHRARGMKKMRVESLAELVRVSEKLSQAPHRYFEILNPDC